MVVTSFRDSFYGHNITRDIEIGESGFHETRSGSLKFYEISFHEISLQDFRSSIHETGTTLTRSVLHVHGATLP